MFAYLYCMLDVNSSNFEVLVLTFSGAEIKELSAIKMRRL